MGSDIGVYTPLKTVVSYVLDEIDSSIGSFDKCWILGLRGLTMMNFDVSGQPETIRILVDGNKTAKYPIGLLSWSKIGVMDSDGQINTLKINNALTTYKDNNPNRLDALAPQINTSIGSMAQVPYYANYYYQGGVYQLYGVGGGVITYGEVKPDDKKRVFILPPDFRFDSILVEGLMSPEKNDDYQVLTCMQEAIIAFIKWKLKLGSREEFYAAATVGRRSMPKKKFVLQTINQVLRESESMKLRS